METALEHKLLNSYKDERISFMKAHPEFWDEAINLAISDKRLMPGGLHGCCGAAWKKMINDFKNMLGVL